MTQTAQPTDKPTAVATIEEGSIADQVLHRVTTMEAANELTLPDGYHVGNALKSAWLYLQSIKDKADRPATQTCTRDIMLLHMSERNSVNNESKITRRVRIATGKRCFLARAGLSVNYSF